MDINKALGQVVVTKRKKLGMTQKDLLDRTQLSRNFMHGFERGVPSSMATLCKIAKALEVNPSALLMEAEFLAMQEGIEEQVVEF